MNPELEARLSALLDGELAPDEAAALRVEIARRPELAARLAELGAVDEALRALPSPAPPAQLRARLVARIRSESAERAPLRRAPARGRRWAAAAALAAAAAALVLALLPQLRRGDAPLPEELIALAEDPPPSETALAEDPAPPETARAEIPAPPDAELAEAPTPPDAGLAEAPAAYDAALEEDLPVIAVLDVLAELDELEEAGSG